MDKNEETAYEDGFVAGMQHDAESRVSKFIDASMREWVGLTDEEVQEIHKWVEFKEEGTGPLPVEKLVQYISHKLKDKNNG